MYRITKPSQGMRRQRMVWIYRRFRTQLPDGTHSRVFRGTGPTNEEALRDALRAVRCWRKDGKP